MAYEMVETEPREFDLEGGARGLYLGYGKSVIKGSTRNEDDIFILTAKVRGEKSKVILSPEELKNVLEFAKAQVNWVE